MGAIQNLYQFLRRLHTVLCLRFRHRQIGIRWVARFNVKLIDIGTIPKRLLQRSPGGNRLSAQEYESVPLLEFTRIFEELPFQGFFHCLLAMECDQVVTPTVFH